MLELLYNERIKDRPRLERIARWHDGHHRDPYSPGKIDEKFRRRLASQSKTNVLPRAVTAIAEGLVVEGFRAPGTAEQDPAWGHWTANDMSDHQDVVHRAALTFGLSYVVVTPTKQGPVIRPFSPLELTAVYANPSFDRYPLAAMSQHQKRDGHRVVWTEWTVYDAEAVSVYRADGEGSVKDARRVVSYRHGMGVCPVVRFVNQAPYAEHVEPYSEVEPLIPLQDRLNGFNFNMLSASCTSAWRQRWTLGVEFDDDEMQLRPGSIMAMQAPQGADTEAKIGEFAASDLRPFLDSITQAYKDMASISSVPLRVLAPEMVNVGADAVASVERDLVAKIEDRQRSFGSSWGRVLRLAALAGGDRAAFADGPGRPGTHAATPRDKRVVVWRDYRQQNFMAITQGLGTLAQMGFPVDVLAELVPGLTPDQVARVKARGGFDAQLADMAFGGRSLIDGDDPRSGAGNGGVPAATGHDRTGVAARVA